MLNAETISIIHLHVTVLVFAGVFKTYIWKWIWNDAKFQYRTISTFISKKYFPDTKSFFFAKHVLTFLCQHNLTCPKGKISNTEADCI